MPAPHRHARGEPPHQRLGGRQVSLPQMPDLRTPTLGILHCLCPSCFQQAIWTGDDYEALCTRCDAATCTNEVSRH